MLGRFYRGRSALLAAVIAMLGLVAAPAGAGPQDAAASKIEQSVRNALADKGSADFIIMLGEKADLSHAAAISDWKARGAAVVNALRATAERSQAGLKAQLDAQKVDYKPYFIVNAIGVRGGSSALATSLAQHGEVTSIRAPQQHSPPKPEPGQVQAKLSNLEWNIAAIHADQVWNTFGARGDGITVASIDTGVDFRHPALVGKYRGNRGDGTFDHNYNWFDPSQQCSSPAPCDTDPAGGGTHLIGTMVGDDGAGNQIGVAPNARWITALGCCRTGDLLSSGEWMLAPTDLNGANPRPDLRPNIVANSWGDIAGGNPTDPFYKGIVQAWRASGIFPVFPNGSDGEFGCETSVSPGDYVESFSAGAFDIDGAIAPWSSRGPGETGTGVIKPNYAAPGVDVRSALPGGGYGPLGGTYVAGAHLAGTVALMWSAAPSLIGNVTATGALLNGSAVDVSDLSCGGTAGANNVWGEGKLDAFAAVQAAPREPLGTIIATVADADTGSPIVRAAVHLAGPFNWDGATGLDGRFTMLVPVGAYTATASAYGYSAGTGVATVHEGQTTIVNLALTRTAEFVVGGHVRDATGAVVPGAKVEILGAPVAPVNSRAEGSYSVPKVALGTYQAKASGGPCYEAQTQALTVTGDVTLDFTLPNRRDTFGHTCGLEVANYVEGDTPLGLSGDDVSTSVDLPFEEFFYGRTYTKAYVTTNGHLNFLAPNSWMVNLDIPRQDKPNAAIYPFWDDLTLDDASLMTTKLSGTAPNREFLIEWRNATFWATDGRVDFEVVLFESGDISLRYRNLDPANERERGAQATIGIENSTGKDAFQYSLDSPVLSDAYSIRFRVPPNGSVTGKVTDFNDGLAVAGAAVRVLSGSTEVSSTTTTADGTYHLRVPAGRYTVEIGKPFYVSSSAELTIGTGTVSTTNAVLHTPRAELTGGPLSFLAEAGQLRTATLNLVSTGDLDLTYTLTSSAPWLWTVPNSVTVPHGSTQPLTVRVDPVGLAPGAVYRATIDLTTNAGRTPTLSVPVTLVVPGYRKGIDAGGGGPVTDTGGDSWVADQAWSAGGFGYLGPGFVETTKKAIAGTDDDTLYQSQRSGMAGYRFDNLPAGTYTVDLDFAELRPTSTRGKRVFDVSINGTTVLPGYDAAAAVGTLTADRKTFTVTVPQGGSIEILFGARKGKQPPIINSLRLTHRPDLGMSG